MLRAHNCYKRNFEVLINRVFARTNFTHKSNVVFEKMKTKLAKHFFFSYHTLFDWIGVYGVVEIFILIKLMDNIHAICVMIVIWAAFKPDPCE